MSDRKGNDQSNDGAPRIEVTEDDIFEELKHHWGLLASDCGDDVGVEHVSIVMRGGAWAAAHVGAVVDGIRASALIAHAKEYCAARNLPHSVTFSLKLYSEDSGTVPTKFWVFREG